MPYLTNLANVKNRSQTIVPVLFRNGAEVIWYNEKWRVSVTIDAPVTHGYDAGYMRHVQQKQKADCGISCTAMLLDVPYSKISAEAAHSYGFDAEIGIDVSTLLRLVRKLSKSRKWKVYAHEHAIPLRHFTPKAAPSILTLVRIYPSGNIGAHFVAYDGHFVHDPAEPRRIPLAKIQADPRWRGWSVASEIIKAR